MERMQPVRATPSAWRELLRKIRTFRVVAGRNATVQALTDGYQINCECDSVGQRQYGGSGGVSAYYTLQQAGGSGGSGGSQCTFVYHLWPLGETAFTDTTKRIATNLQPQPIHRDETGLYSQAPTGSIGEAVQVGTTWTLLTAFGERRLTQGCA